MSEISGGTVYFQENAPRRPSFLDCLRGFVCVEEQVVYSYNKKLVSTAQGLRKNMTSEERHLWYDFLKRLPVAAKRQKNIENYILDFYIPSAKLAIEVDGRQHKLPEHLEQDRLRDEKLASLGIAVVRYTNEDVRNRFQAVAEDILMRLGLGFEDLRDE